MVYYRPVFMLYLGADHLGFPLKEEVKAYLTERGVAFEDLGATVLTPGDDYVDYALPVARAVAENPSEHRGVLICGSGIGMNIAANKIKGIRAGLVTDVTQAAAARNDDDTNIVCLAGDFTSTDKANEIIDTWIKTPFSAEDRHVRRIEKIMALEQ